MRPAVLVPPFPLSELPDIPAVFLVFASEGRPYLGRTARIRRRLARLLGERATTSRMLSLREIALRVEIDFTASRLAAALRFHERARQHYPNDYVRLVKLRFPPYVKIVVSNAYPRTMVTTRLSGSGGKHYGPFRTRAGAERFESEVLDLFQVRRCQEDLDVSPDHPGCIYGEMGRCMRPCQAVVSRDEYLSEVQRLAQFLESGGESLAGKLRAARERSSEEMDFEEAQHHHQRLEKIDQALKLRDDLACDLDHLYGIAVTASPRTGFVELRLFQAGSWMPAIEFRVAPEASGEMVPMDRRLREAIASPGPAKTSLRDRAEHTALLARWFYSSWRDGEWIPFPSAEALPYRKLVRAISRVATASQAGLF